MLYVALAIGLFLVSVAIHLALCRAAKRQGLLLKSFFVIAGFNLILLWTIFYVWSLADTVETFGNRPYIVSASVFYILLIPTYLVFYFSTQQVSPSKKLMLLLTQRDLTLKELYDHFTDKELIQPRLDDLVLTNCIVLRDGRYQLTASGQKMAWLYTFYQTLLGRKKGG